jgi:hypothetical protein
VDRVAMLNGVDAQPSFRKIAMTSERQPAAAAAEPSCCGHEDQRAPNVMFYKGARAPEFLQLTAVNLSSDRPLR